VWLRDGLPQALPNTRIMAYGYDSRLSGSASFASTSDYGKSLLANVASARVTSEESPAPHLIEVQSNINPTGSTKAIGIHWP
jgi:hypothetical protein